MNFKQLRALTGKFLIDQVGAGAALWTLSGLCPVNVALTLMIWQRIR
ncbi:hypothetical protein RBI22_21975 [Alcaligenaceae bacterium C4P045]|nr:hypothetical protein [Alcaligenaceae bacterium C4P045]